MSKAIAVDEVAPGAVASSCAEDAFFVAQRCSKRALATGHAGAASAVVNHAGNTLGVDLLEALVRKVFYVAPHFFLLGGGGGGDGHRWIFRVWFFGFGFRFPSGVGFGGGVIC